MPYANPGTFTRIAGIDREEIQLVLRWNLAQSADHAQVLLYN
jgi:hypothetical protein